MVEDRMQRTPTSISCSVNNPDRPSGPTSGYTNTDHTYTTGGFSCAAGHSVQYRFTWRRAGGSWNFDPWSNSSSITLSFSQTGTYEIDAQARCTLNQTISNYSPVLTVEIVSGSATSSTYFYWQDTRNGDRIDWFMNSNGVTRDSFEYLDLSLVHPRYQIVGISKWVME